jgi:hypothetical protein
MVVADPDETLIEAIRAAVREQALDRFLSEALTPDARNWVAGFSARAAYAAMTEHLGLVEETRAEPDALGGMVEVVGEVHMVCKPPTMKRRLVSRWVEVDHGSE